MICKEKPISYEEFVFIISESLGVELDDIDEDTSFIDDLGIDSLSLMDCIIKLEKKYGIKLQISNIWELKSVKKAYDAFAAALVTV